LACQTAWKDQEAVVGKVPARYEDEALFRVTSIFIERTDEETDVHRKAGLHEPEGNSEFVETRKRYPIRLQFDYAQQRKHEDHRKEKGQKNKRFSDWHLPGNR
jgi:hypothetical protein